jgi:hypothetical protein
MWSVQKDKTYIVKCLIFSIEFCLFFVGQTASPFFMKQLCAPVTCEDLCANFYLDFLDISKYAKYCIQIKGAYASGSQNTLFFTKFSSSSIWPAEGL